MSDKLVLMKKFLPIFLILVICYMLGVTYIRADFDRAYQDYLYQYDQYRKNLTIFLSAKNRYLTYGTLTSQTEALIATKSFLEARDVVSTTYLQMLLEKNPDESYKKLIGDELTFFTNHKALIPAVGSLNDGVDVSEKFDEHFPLTKVIARQTIANIILGKIQNLDNRLANLTTGSEEKINSLKNQGKDVTTLERWLLETKNKRLLSQQKFNEAQNQAAKLKPTKYSIESSENFDKVQILIFESNQYLKEATAYLKEIKEELKYGNY